MAPTRGYLFAGTERGDLHAWDMATMQLRQTVRGHRGHILAAIVTNDGRLLMTAGGENAVGRKDEWSRYAFHVS